MAKAAIVTKAGFIGFSLGCKLEILTWKQSFSVERCILDRSLSITPSGAAVVSAKAFGSLDSLDANGVFGAHSSETVSNI
ncbi:MAG: hypothetical protein ACLQF1_07435 [Methyloceanibacter sp.]